MFLVPVAVFISAWALLTLHRRRLGLYLLSGRGTFVVSQIAFQAMVVLITESLSIGRHLTPTWVEAAWLLALVVLVVLLAVGMRQRGWGRDQLARGARHLPVWIRRQSIESRVGLCVISLIVATMAAISWLYPPSNADSMVYHLTRVAHWVQDHSVGHFATHYLAQVEFSPLHEYNMLHLHLLFGRDRLDGYPQLVAFVVCIAGASELARLLGGTGRVQLWAAIICATIPSAILEASSTQNNLFAASIGVGILVLLLAWPLDGPWIGCAILLGLASGLAVLSKGTLPALIGPAALLLALRLIVVHIRSSSLTEAARRLAAVIAFVAFCAGLVAFPFFHRNFELFGSPFGPESERTRVIEPGLRAGAANVVRSTAVNFRIGNGTDGPATFVSRAALGGLRRVYTRLDVAPDDVRYMLGTETDAFRIQDYGLVNRFEEYGANPWHVLLLTFSGVAIGFRYLRGERSLRLATLLAVGLAIGFVVFSATARWSVFVVRYQEPLLVAWSPLIAIALAGLPRLIGQVVVVLLVLACLPQLFDNAARSLRHPEFPFSSDLDPYFPGVNPAETDYLAVRDAIARSKCNRVGISNWILLEYPIWAGLDHVGWKGEIEHVNVMNESRKLEHKSLRPCALLREAGPDYVPGSTGPGETRYGNLVLAIDPDGTVPTTAVP